MFVPTLPSEPLLIKNGDEYELNKPWENFFLQLTQNMQQAVSNEGFLVPGQTSANMTIIQNGVDSHGNQIAIPGTMLFNNSAVNGGSSPAPNGQLYVLLQDGLFHPITNT